ncbi:protein RGF1 INDUCIBLE TRANSCRIPTION FACTOR 1 [Syzygium oleosum]|uniref:protein RGF1 INDUCIBLE TRANSCRIPTION FACTOR 1 n=1 Tax=Syzygium oleosum TaxID=219896 RepID=UPI0011D25793|nr:protein RGF1 INDUCIBLE TRANSCRIPTION FACTOR 1 [Syzygium oleosum]
MIGCGFYAKKRPPSDCWLSTLLRGDFFGSCVAHHYLRKNEKNVFCIDCRVGFCKHCMAAHGLHRRLQICKYVYQDVVRLQEVQKHLDCSKIQTYKINGEKAVHLNPRPQSRDTKPSTKSKNGGTCEACGRYIQDLPNRFCSIACKVSVVSMKPNNEQSPDVITIPIEELTDLSLKDNYCSSSNGDEKESSVSLAESSEDAHFGVSSVLKPRRRSHKRKGFPRRAPLQ